MRLNDGVVELRAPRRSDITELHRAIHASMPELLPWMAWAHPGYTDNEASEWVRRAARAFADGVEFQFVARELEHGQLLGTVGLNTIDRVNRWANLGYWLATPHTGRGYMTRAAQLVVEAIRWLPNFADRPGGDAHRGKHHDAKSAHGESDSLENGSSCLSDEPARRLQSDV